jgi:Protein of unknown function, DUF547
VEQLGKVNPGNLSSDERLAFWINLFNALIMHVCLLFVVLSIISFFFFLLKIKNVGCNLYQKAI